MANHKIYALARPDGTDGQERLELQWQAGVYLQLGVTKWAGDPAHVDSTLTYLPQRADAKVGDTPPEAWPGWFIEMDRDKVNHLIRELRKARDQVFGKDE